MGDVFSGEMGDKKAESLASFDLSRLEYAVAPNQGGLIEGSGLRDSVAGSVEIEYNGNIMTLEATKREGFFDNELVNEEFQFILKSGEARILEFGLFVDLSPEAGGLPVVESVVKKAEAASQKPEFKNLGILFTERAFVFLEDLARNKKIAMLSKAEYGPRVSGGELSLDDWQKIFVPLFEKMGYVQKPGENVWYKKLG